MSALVEFHVSSAWALKPYGVRQVIAGLKEAKYVSTCDHPLPPVTTRLGADGRPHTSTVHVHRRLMIAQGKAEFQFDPKHNWFQVTCQSDDERKVKQQLKQFLAGFEEEALDDDVALVDEDGAVVVSSSPCTCGRPNHLTSAQKALDNAWIGSWNQEALLEVADFKEFRLPEAFHGLPHQDVYSLRRLNEVMTKAQFEDMQKKHNVILGYNLSLTDVYIGAESSEEVAAVRQKLDVLLNLKVKTCEPPS